MELLKYRIINKINILIFFLFLGGLFVTAYYDLGWNEINPITFDAKGYGVENLSKEEQRKFRKDLFSNFTEFEFYGMNIGSFFVLMPTLACASVLTFAKEKKGLFSYKFSRGKDLKKVITSSILTNSFITAFTLWLAWAIYLTIGLTFCNMTAQPVNVDLLDIIFGIGFGQKHMYLFFLLMGLEQIFLFAFVFSMLSYSLCLFIEKTYVAMLIPLAYYFAGNYIFVQINRYIDLSNLRPGYTVALTGYAHFNAIIEGLYPMIIPIIVSVLLITYAIVRREQIDF